MSLRIKTLEELKKWNANPSKELPIIYDWFMRWFFEEVLMNDNEVLAKDAYDTLIISCMICEKFDEQQAKERVDRGIGYFAGHSKDWYEKLNKYFPDINHPILGKNYHPKRY